MKTRSVIIKVPAPTARGFCSINCELRVIHSGYSSCAASLDHPKDRWQADCKPGQGCPWNSKTRPGKKRRT